MENREKEREQQVLQRVFARREAPMNSDLRELMGAVVELLSVYRYLLKGGTASHRELLRRLYEGEQANLSALKGISLLSGGGGEVLKLWQSTKESERRLLTRCYHSTRRCAVEYMARSADPDYGVVFRILADREGQHCALLTELLGGKQ